MSMARIVQCPFAVVNWGGTLPYIWRNSSLYMCEKGRDSSRTHQGKCPKEVVDHEEKSN